MHELRLRIDHAFMPVYCLQIEHLQAHLQFCMIKTSKCISKHAQSQPPSVSLSSLHHSLQVQLWVHSITASKLISKLPWWWLPSAYLWPLHLGLKVYIQVCSATAFKYITKLVKLWPPSIYMYSSDHGLQFLTIMDCKYISKLPLLMPSRALRRLQNWHLYILLRWPLNTLCSYIDRMYI